MLARLMVAVGHVSLLLDIRHAALPIQVSPFLLGPDAGALKFEHSQSPSEY
jgi:hypothetical protein